LESTAWCEITDIGENCDKKTEIEISKVLMDIANEERVHEGEIGRLLEILIGDEAAFQAEGASGSRGGGNESRRA
jgi:rubrerythrin